jgi:hypothetical protein
VSLVPFPEAAVAWRDPRLRGGWFAIAAAAIVAFVFLPTSFTNNDEYYYAGQAYTLTQGRLAPALGDPLLLPEETPEQAFRYPVAWPAALAAGRVVGIPGMYVVALIAHLLGGAAAARLLVRRGVPSAFAAAYLFHPVCWIYSRTLLSDVPATAMLLFAMDAWENRKDVSAGASLGFAAGMRLANVFVVFGFGLAVLSQLRRRLAGVASLIVGVVAFSIVQMVVNRILGGYWLVSRYATQGAGMFTGSMVFENAALYLGGLALLPPFPLVAALVRPKRVDRWAWVAIVTVAVYLPISFHNVSPNLLETLVGGQRYVLPAHAALMVATAGTWSSVRVLRVPWLPVAAGVVLAVGASLAMRRIENRHRPAVQFIRACGPHRLAYNRFANRVAGSVAARSYRVVPNAAGAGSDWDVMVLAPGYLSNQPGFATGWEGPPPELAGARCYRSGLYAIYDATGRCPAADPCHAAAPTR